MMEKDFDRWNARKKYIHTRPDNVGAHECEIWWLSLGVNVGVEIDGKHNNFERPVLVIKRFNRQMAWILPTTSRIKSNRFHEKFLFNGDTYFVALTQIRTISTKRFLRKIGMIPKIDFCRIKQRLDKLIETNEDPLY